eukprot:NODE_602_length_5512_cov_0.250693.p2 type:complete len:441 gc:universal NODE_602_length_5512_cov_0.250693:2487-3809(+)
MTEESLYSIARTQLSKNQKRIGDYLILKTIGSGSMGKVKLGVHYKLNYQVAIKLMPRKQDSRCIREIAVMKYCNHPNIIRCFEAFQSPNYWYIISEYVNGYQVLDWVIAHIKIKEDQARPIIRMLVSAVSYLHRHCIAHRDLKIENLLIDKNGNLKLIDFGLSNFSHHELLNTFCGSLYFASPELLKAQPYNPFIADCWSLGIIIYVICSGKVPFDDQNLSQLHNKIKNGEIHYPDYFSSDLLHLLTELIQVDPHLRIDIEQVRMSRWLNMEYSDFVHCHVPLRNKTCDNPKHAEILELIGFKDVHQVPAIQMHHLIDEYTPYQPIQSISTKQNVFQFMRSTITTRLSTDLIIDKLSIMSQKHEYILQKGQDSIKISSEISQPVSNTSESVYSDFGQEMCIEIIFVKMWKWMGLKISRIAGDLYAYQNMVNLIKKSLKEP